ncbi:Haloacetate dehalogenase H-2, partial [Talaromyces pinophilus]
ERYRGVDRDEKRRRDDVVIDKNKETPRRRWAGSYLTVLAFDLYGTLLSTESISKRLTEIIGSQEKGTQIAASWRKYQLEYSWRLTCMGSYDNFFNITRNALGHALSEAVVQLEEEQIKQLMDEYDHLSTFPDVTAALQNLNSRPDIKSVIFSNGTREMVSNSVFRSQSLSPHAALFADLVTVDAVQKFKPAPEATQRDVAASSQGQLSLRCVLSKLTRALQGIVYFASHPFLWPLLRSRLLPIFLLSGFIYTLLFFFAYLPQVAFLAIFQGHSAWVNGAFLVLGEGSAIVALLFEAFFVDETLVDVFDAVLINEGFEVMVNKERVIHPDGINPVQRLGKPTTSAVYAPFSFRQIIEFIFLLPLNFVPVAGVPMFLVLTGYRGGPFHHWRYFQLLELTKDKRKRFVRNRQLKYTAFGTVALILQLIPIFSMLFLLTSAAGSALWAAEMEKHKAFLETHQSEREEEYHDDPA